MCSKSQGRKELILRRWQHAEDERGQVKDSRKHERTLDDWERKKAIWIRVNGGDANMADAWLLIKMSCWRFNSDQWMKTEFIRCPESSKASSLPQEMSGMLILICFHWIFGVQRLRTRPWNLYFKRFPNDSDIKMNEKDSWVISC